jgi:site-specific recombinase XerD
MNGTRVGPLLLQIVGGTVRNAVNGFLVERQSCQFSPNTLKLYTLELGYFCAYLDGVGIGMLTELTPDAIRRYLLELSEHRNAGGCHASYRVIKTFLRWDWDEFELEGRNPIAWVETPKINPQPLPGIPVGDIQRMIAACNTVRAQM